MALNNNARTAKCSHTRGSEGKRSLRIATSTTSAAAPSATRPRATHSADQYLSSTLMNRKLAPQNRLARHEHRLRGARARGHALQRHHLRAGALRLGMEDPLFGHTSKIEGRSMSQGGSDGHN